MGKSSEMENIEMNFNKVHPEGKEGEEEEEKETDIDEELPPKMVSYGELVRNFTIVMQFTFFVFFKIIRNSIIFLFNISQY